jgi:hypothetical protein
MEFVINEWFPEYFIYPEGSKEKTFLKKFVNKFYNSKDVLFIKRPSEFWSKLHRYSKQYHANEDIYRELKIFISVILQDSNRVKIIDEDIELPNEVLGKLNIMNTNFFSDQYLFEAAFKSDSKIIVTTDIKLIGHMGKSEFYNLVLLDDFMEEYCK